MDAFSWIILLALGACLVLHLFGHGHGHGHSHGDHGAQTRHRDSEARSADAGGSVADREGVAARSGHRHGGGCH